MKSNFDKDIDKDIICNKKLLLLDTEKNVLLTYQKVLQDEGYQVDIVMDEPSALDKISLQPFAVVISELYLRGKKTINLLKKIKEAHPEIYIVIITATTLTSGDCQEITNAGVDDYFTKPFSPEALLPTIQKGLKRRDLVLKNIQLEDTITSISNTYSTDHISPGKNTICNKQFFNLKLQYEITRAKRYKHPFSLVVFELTVQDNGHHSGSLNKDKISEQLYKVLPNITRRTDVLTQNNGNFALILVETSINGAKYFTSRFQEEIAKLNTGVDIHMQAELSELLKIEYHSFPEHSDYIQHWSNT